VFYGAVTAVIMIKLAWSGCRHSDQANWLGLRVCLWVLWLSQKADTRFYRSAQSRKLSRPIGTVVTSNYTILA